MLRAVLLAIGRPVKIEPVHLQLVLESVLVVEEEFEGLTVSAHCLDRPEPEHEGPSVGLLAHGEVL